MVLLAGMMTILQIAPTVKGVGVKRIALIVTAVLVLVLGIISCTSVDQADTPTYTADQVIAVAQARYPDYESYSGRTLSPSISVAYIGESVWRVNISCPSGYRVSGRYVGSNITLYFYETTGVLTVTQPD